MSITWFFGKLPHEVPPQGNGTTFFRQPDRLQRIIFIVCEHQTPPFRPKLSCLSKNRSTIAMPAWTMDGIFPDSRLDFRIHMHFEHMQ